MSLTTGRGPLSLSPAGRFDCSVPARTVYVEPWLRRVRGVLQGRTLIDCERVVLVHRAGEAPRYAFPEREVPPEVRAAPEPAVPGYVQVPWDAVTSWYEEEEQVLGHPRNPYHRVDCIRSRRRLRVEVGSLLLVDTTDTMGVYETARAPQLYVRREDVRSDRLVVSQTRTYCPYKGTATHWSAEVDGTLVPDVCWSYQDPLPECTPIAGWLAFYPERTSIAADVLLWFGVPQAAVQDGVGRSDPGHSGPGS